MPVFSRDFENGEPFAGHGQFDGAFVDAGRCFGERSAGRLHAGVVHVGNHFDLCADDVGVGAVEEFNTHMVFPHGAGGDIQIGNE